MVENSIKSVIEAESDELKKLTESLDYDVVNTLIKKIQNNNKATRYSFQACRKTPVFRTNSANNGRSCTLVNKLVNFGTTNIKIIPMAKQPKTIKIVG